MQLEQASFEDKMDVLIYSLLRAAPHFSESKNQEDDKIRNRSEPSWHGSLVSVLVIIGSIDRSDIELSNAGSLFDLC